MTCELQDFEAGSMDPLDRMSTKQVVKILTESYMNSDFHMMALTRVHEINQNVSLKGWLSASLITLLTPYVKRCDAKSSHTQWHDFCHVPSTCEGFFVSGCLGFSCA